MKKGTKSARAERRKHLGHLLSVAELDLTGFKSAGGSVARSPTAARDKACAVIADPHSTPKQRRHATDLIKRAHR